MDFLIRHSAEHFIIGKSDSRDNYIRRNCYMVDHSDYLLAVYDNDRKANHDPIQAVGYAEKHKKKVILIHPDTAEVSMLSSWRTNH